MPISLSRRVLVGTLAVLPLLAASGSSVAAAQSVETEQVAPVGVTTVILVRHAEKANVPGADPPLSPTGEARSLALLEALRDAGVEAMIVTQLQRTRLTAAPLSAHLGIEPEVVAVGGDPMEHARRVAQVVLERHGGRTVLVVGHSNTIPAIVEALGGGRIPEIREDEYQDVHVVTRPAEGGGATRRLVFRYGAGG